MVRNLSRAAAIALAAALLAGRPSAEARNADTVRPAALMDTGLTLTDGLKAYDVDHITVDLEIMPKKRMIAGSATIDFTAAAALSILELDFDGAFRVSQVRDGTGVLRFTKTTTKLLVTLSRPLAAGERGSVRVAYKGAPVVAKKAPWDGGFVWDKTPGGKDWIATAVQGEGCDVWFPCKDHPLGEPRGGADLIFTVPAGLTAVSNGVLVKEDRLANGRGRFHWRTRYSTNIYGFALNVGPYVKIERPYTSVNGSIFPVVFYALQEREAKARALFDTQFFPIIAHFERTLGPYPWAKEKLGVVETPHMGMEHQTVNAYGANYRRGDYGYDPLFQHELAHEWFGNLLSVRNNADMWLHEGTGAYMQPVYTEALLGDAISDSARYRSYLGILGCVATAPRGEYSEDKIYNAENGGPGGDIYAKGSAVLHSLRFVMGEEKFWNAIRRLLYGTPRPWSLTAEQITPVYRTTDDFVAIVSEEAGAPMDWFFETYIRSAAVPELDVERRGGTLALAWRSPAATPFPMPIPVRIDGKLRRVEMPGGTATLKVGDDATVEIDPGFDVLRKLPSLPTCAERETERKAEEAEHKRVERKK